MTTQPRGSVLRRMAAREKALTTVCFQLLREPNPQAMADALVRGVRSLLAVDQLELVVLREDGRVLAAAAAEQDSADVEARLSAQLEESRQHRSAWYPAHGVAYLPLWDEQRLVALLRLSQQRPLHDWQRAGLDRAARSLAVVVGRNLRMYELERRYTLHRRLVEMAQEGIWLAGRHDETVFVNTRMAEMLGYRPEEMIGRPVYDFMPPEERPTAQDHLECERRGQVRKSDFRFLRRDGTELWAIVSAGPVRSEDGRYVGGLALVTDISDRKRMEEALRDSEARLRLVIDQFPGVLWTVDHDLRVTSVRGAGLKVMSRQAEELLGRTGPELVGTEDPLHDLVRQALKGESVLTEGRWFGRLHQVRLEPLRDAAGRIIGCLGISWDVTELRQSQAELARERERSHVILESIADSVIATDAEGHIAYMNPAAETATGWPEAEAVGRPAEEVVQLLNELTGQPLGEQLRSALRGNHLFRMPGQALLRRRDGRLIPVEDTASPTQDSSGVLLGSVLVFHDVSASRQLAEQLRHQASHDALTGLPNRDLLLDRLGQAMGQAERRHGRLAVLFLDLDRFKHINDTLGHAFGDELLKQVAQRLQATVRRTDTVCRLGGDEFVILLAQLERIEDVTDLAEKLSEVIAQPFGVDDHELHLTTSIGIALYPDDGDSREALLQNADIAMYHAKESGRSTFRYFTADMNQRAAERLFLEHGLRRVLERGELAVHYQPQVALRSGAVIGVEALLRWRHPQLGLIAPERFIPVAEDTGLIIEIGSWVLMQACRQGQAWRAAGLPVRVAVNMSAVQFRQADTVAMVTEALRKSDLPAGALELELTESVVMRDAAQTAERLRRLKELGVRIAVDDFGTGYSSLSYLKQFPVDSLKIDQSFIRNVAHEPSDAAIATAIIRMAHSLKLRVMAEGVENAMASAFLASQGCDGGQGNFYGRPRLPAEIEQLLRRRHAKH